MEGDIQGVPCECSSGVVGVLDWTGLYDSSQCGVDGESVPAGGL